MMTRTFTIFTLVAAAALAGCGDENHNIVSTGPDEGTPSNAIDNTNIQLPPSIASSKAYRCADNKLVYVDWLSDNKSANVRSDKNGAATHVAGPEAGQAMVAEGYSLTGSATAATITYNGKSCKA